MVQEGILEEDPVGEDRHKEEPAALVAVKEEEEAHNPPDEALTTRRQWQGSSGTFLVGHWKQSS